MRWLTRSVRKHWKPVLGIILIVVIIVCTTAVIRNRDTSGFPRAVKKQASFSIFYPSVDDNDPNVEVGSETVLYSKANHAISYEASVNSQKVVVTEQRTPDVFSESGVYSYKLGQARQYATFETNAGQVYLTKPKELNGATLAWLNSKGTLTLVRAFGDLNQSQWETFFDSMVVVN